MAHRVAFALVALIALAGGCATDAMERGADAGPDAADAGLCGGATCAAGQHCVHPCCGGAAPACDPLPDGGACPPGTTPVASCPTSGGPGCQAGPCSPPPAYCSKAIPVGCQLDASGEVVCLCA